MRTSPASSARKNLQIELQPRLFDVGVDSLSDSIHTRGQEKSGTVNNVFFRKEHGDPHRNSMQKILNTKSNGQQQTHLGDATLVKHTDPADSKQASPTHMRFTWTCPVTASVLRLCLSFLHPK